MQSIIVNRAVLRPAAVAVSCCGSRGAASTLKSSATGHVYQVRTHVKMYPWRANRNNSECYLDNTRTPYTDKYNINEFRSTKKKLKPWQKVIRKDRDNRFNAYKWDDAYKSDPKEAKETSHSRMQRFSDSLRDRGEARESKTYIPPDNVRERILALYRNSCLKQAPNTGHSTANSGQTAIINNADNGHDDDDILNLDLNSHRELKFKLISDCIDIFQHNMPSSYLNDINTIGDVIEYFSTPVRGINPYDHLVNNRDLPPNLSIISEPNRYNKETDEFFKGHNALPGIICKVPGLRASKKYPILNQDEFQWPDI